MNFERRYKSIECNNCHQMDSMGLRFRCLVCIDFNLCAICHSLEQLHVSDHTISHPTQCILSSSCKELFFDGEEDNASMNDETTPPQSLTCPHCSVIGFTFQTLLDHVSKKHLNDISEVLCPVCVCCLKAESKNLATGNLALHLLLKHGMPGTRFDTLMHVNDARDVEFDLSNDFPTSISRETTPIDYQKFQLQHYYGRDQPESSDDWEPRLMALRNLELRRLAFRSSKIAAKSESARNMRGLRCIFAEIKKASAFNIGTIRCEEPTPMSADADCTSVGTDDDAGADANDSENNGGDDADNDNDNNNVVVVSHGIGRSLFLLPNFFNCAPNILHLKMDALELWHRADFVQSLLMSMLAINDLSKVSESIAPEKKLRGSFNEWSTWRTSLEPSCIDEDSEEENDNTESSEI